MLREIRSFFAERGVLEVETPLLGQACGTDPNLQPFTSSLHWPGTSAGVTLYLQTSPEFAMKRLLAAGSGSIYQICKAFRNEESGRQHNPEFSLLEWYRVGFSLDDLRDEIDHLLQRLFAGYRELQPAISLSYREAFHFHTGLDPLAATIDDFIAYAKHSELPEARLLCSEHIPLWLDLLFSHRVQPNLQPDRLNFINDYPALLPSLARCKSGEPEVVERMEVFLDGIELGNGFHELCDANEQNQRFDADLLLRKESGLFMPPKDERLLAALESGLPDCSGVALGLDRILMLRARAKTIDEVVAFPVRLA